MITPKRQPQIGFGPHGKGETFRVTVVPSIAGPMLVAATPKGLSHVQFGDHAEALLSGFKAEMHQATIAETDDEFTDWVEQLTASMTSGEYPDLPLDVRGSDFQRRVWQALQRIPAGETASYSDIANAIGQPTATRAVASACGANTIAVIIPCHRVIAKNGGIGGYHWGLAVKRALLASEQQAHGTAVPHQTVLSFG